MEVGFYRNTQNPRGEKVKVLSWESDSQNVFFVYLRLYEILISLGPVM